MVKALYWLRPILNREVRDPNPHKKIHKQFTVNPDIASPPLQEDKSLIKKPRVAYEHSSTVHLGSQFEEVPIVSRVQLHSGWVPRVNDEGN